MRQPRKIMMLATGHSPFDDRIYFKEALSLSKKYARIIIVAPGREAENKGDSGIEHLPLPEAGSLIARAFLIFRAAGAVMRERPDVCHLHDFELIFLLPFLRLFSKCKIIYDVHEVYPEAVLDSNKISKFLQLPLAIVVDITERILARLAHYIVTSDSDIAKRFETCHRVATLFNYPRVSGLAFDEHGISFLKGRYVNRVPIIYQGSMSKQRGVFQLLDAMKILRDRRSDIILLLVGAKDNDLLREVSERIKDYGLGDCVEVVKWIPHTEVFDYIRVSRLGIIPFLPTKKLMKNIPIKQFEYMACGVPVLGSDLPPISSYVKAAGCGRVFDPGSAEALAAAALDMLKDEDEWKRMSEAGRKAVRELWNWEKMEAELFSVYEEVLA